MVCFQTTFVPIVLNHRGWIEAFRSCGENPSALFEGPITEWTADQKRLVSVSKEYASAFSALATRGHEPPHLYILEDYRMFRDWWENYLQDPVDGNPYKKYTQGFSTKR